MTKPHPTPFTTPVKVYKRGIQALLCQVSFLTQFDPVYGLCVLKTAHCPRFLCLNLPLEENYEELLHNLKTIFLRMLVSRDTSISGTSLLTIRDSMFLRLEVLQRKWTRPYKH